MIINFDKFNKTRIPSLILCNPNGDKLFHMPMAKDRNLSVKLNALSELTFTVSDIGDSTPYYDFLISPRYIEVPNVARFVITNVKETCDGIEKYKEVTCKGLEYELSSKNMGLMEGTYKFYDPSSADKSLMNIVLSYLPNWKIGTIEDDLWNIYRTFDIKDNNIYNFLMTEVQEAYQCIFIIDTFNRTISAKKVDSIIIPSDIFLSDKNLIKSLDINEDAEKIKTSLDVYGDGDLSIHSVNPLGTATIYDFSYYKSVPDMMSSGLIDAITKWEIKLENSKAEYATLLTEIKTDNTAIIGLNTQLAQLKSELKTLQEEEAMKVAAGEDLSDVQSRISTKKAEIVAKENEIKSEQSIIDTKRARLKAISVELKFETNFTKDELNELTTYIIQETHQCTNFSVTDAMTNVEKQEVMQELYDYGAEQLRRVAQPTYTFDIDVVNFLRLFEYKYTIEQFELGCEVTICIDRDKDKYARVMLLGYDTNLDDQTDLTLHFSNKLKFGDDKYKWEELMDKSNSISTSVDFESPSWNKGEIANSKIDDYMNSALDLTQQEIINADNQEFTLTAQGLRGKEWDETNKRYKPEQLWMTKNVLAFSDNGFTGRPRMALGKILAPDGTMVYGLNAEVVVGNIMLTKKLVVENENSTFRVDGEKVYIKNADIIMTNDGKETTLENALANAGNEIYYQATAPQNPRENDIWYDTGNKNKAKVYKNGAWQDATDKDITNALSTANTANTNASSALDKIGKVTDVNGNLNASAMVGQILAGKSNIVCASASTTGNVLCMNENGIVVGTRSANGSINTSGGMTCITKDGIVADAIKSGTIRGVTIIGGSESGVHTVVSPSEPLQVKVGNTTAIRLWAENFANGRKYLEMYDGAGDVQFKIDASASTKTLFSKGNMWFDCNRVGSNVETGWITMDVGTIFNVRNTHVQGQGTCFEANYYSKNVTIGADSGWNISANGTFTATDKRAAVKTNTYGWRQLFCDESDMAYFSTHGHGETLENNGRYKCAIRIDDAYLETVELNKDNPYMVQITPHSLCKIGCINRYDKYFIVESDTPTKFDYTVRSIRRGYVDNRLPEVGNIFRENSMDDYSIKKRNGDV